MKWRLRLKLAQHWQSFGSLLLSTDNLPIVEDSRKDDYWGAKPVTTDTLSGQNVLGRLLMELREKLKEKPESLKIVEPVPIEDFLLLARPIPVITIDDTPLPAGRPPIRTNRTRRFNSLPMYIRSRDQGRWRELGLGFRSAPREKLARPSSRRHRTKAPTATSRIKLSKCSTIQYVVFPLRPAEAIKGA